MLRRPDGTVEFHIIELDINIYEYRSSKWKLDMTLTAQEESLPLEQRLSKYGARSTRPSGKKLSQVIRIERLRMNRLIMVQKRRLHVYISLVSL